MDKQTIVLGAKSHRDTVTLVPQDSPLDLLGTLMDRSRCPWVGDGEERVNHSSLPSLQRRDGWRRCPGARDTTVPFLERSPVWALAGPSLPGNAMASKSCPENGTMNLSHQATKRVP